MKAEKMLLEMFSDAGIEINGKMPWDIQVHNNRFFQRLVAEAALGLGESYMDGWWDCEALDECINRMLRAKFDLKIKGNWKIYFYVMQSRLFNRQKRSRAHQVGEQHYDLGDELYRAMLDSRMNYTC